MRSSVSGLKHLLRVVRGVTRKNDRLFEIKATSRTGNMCYILVWRYWKNVQVQRYRSMSDRLYYTVVNEKRIYQRNVNCKFSIRKEESLAGVFDGEHKTGTAVPETGYNTGNKEKNSYNGRNNRGGRKGGGHR